MTRPDVQWERQPAAERLVRELVDDLLGKCPGAASLARRMAEGTGTRFIDWVDHIARPADDAYAGRLIAAGFRLTDPDTYVHPAAVLPAIVFTRDVCLDVAIKVASSVETSRKT